MSLDLLLPVEDLAVAHMTLVPEMALGKNISVHSKQNGLPDMGDVKIALLTVPEGRNAVDNVGTGKGYENIRKFLYQMYPGNWMHKIADLGNLPRGKTVKDTYAVLQQVLESLFEKNITPIIIGGGQDLTYACYRAYFKFKKGVNAVSVDPKFDIDPAEKKITSQNYLYKMVMDEPNNLYQFSNLGFQTFFNSQEEIDLFDKLHFDAYRLGEVSADITSVEPVLRESDILSVDIGAVRMSEAPGNQNASPNGFYGDQICAITRYAGISTRNSLLGIFEYNPKYDERNQTAHLIAQMIWYYIEGYNFRMSENPLEDKKNFQKFIVLIEDDTINFFKSVKSERWWMEISFSHNKTQKSTLIPCTYQDYLTASNQVYPERLLKTLRKLNA